MRGMPISGREGMEKKSPLMAEFTGRSYAPNASNVFYFQANEKRAEICKYAQQEGNGTRRPNVIDWLRYRFDRSLLSRYRHCFFVFFFGFVSLGALVFRRSKRVALPARYERKMNPVQAAVLERKN